MIIKIVGRRKDCPGCHRVVGIFLGKDADHLALAGDITVRPEEWAELIGSMPAGPVYALHGSVEIRLEDRDPADGTVE